MLGVAHHLSLKELTKIVRKYDPKLYVTFGGEGKAIIMREGFTYKYYDYEGMVLGVQVRDDYLVCPLTNNWSMTGHPVPWGEDKILNRLGEIDAWKKNVEKELKDNQEKVEASKQRDLSNKAEAFASEYHSEFKKAFSDVNTANMKKIDRRRLDDKKIKRR